MSALDKALAAQREATKRLATIVADDTTALGGTPKEVIEALELLRYQLHREIDDAIDAEQLTRPPGGRAWRARRYRELTAPVT